MSNFVTQLTVQMLKSLITSQTRVKLLKKFFLNYNTTAHLRGLEAEFGESSNAIRIELNRFEEAGLLNSTREGNRKLFKANKKHPLFEDIHNIILKETGLNQIVEKVVQRLGELDGIYLVGDFARGVDSQMIDLIFTGSKIDSDYLARKVSQAEEIVHRKINYVFVHRASADNYLLRFEPKDILPLWNKAGDEKVV